MEFKKVLFDEENETPCFESLSKIFPDCINKLYEEKLEELKGNIIFAINKCESPIEQLMAIHLNDLIESSRAYLNNLDIVDVENQAELQIGGKLARVDFLIPVYDNENKVGRFFVVECDGHEFHQKTKEQVQNDYERTRLLQSKGYVVIKFTGSEIYKHPEFCKREVETIIINHFRSK